jgi:CRISPR-associated protein Csm1
MDVDNLGKIFSRGLEDNYSLPRLGGLSRQLSYFFTIYLNSLAERRTHNLPAGCIKADSLLDEGKEDRLNLVFIYAGGDDLFVVGAWNEVVAFSLDTYQAFRTYTGHNPDITISGGIYLANIKFPLYQAAELAGEAEEQAKGNGRDSLGLFGEVFKWDEWLGKTTVMNKLDDAGYLDNEPEAEYFGIIPIAELINSDIKYSRGFIRNLLTVADLQEQKLGEIERANKREPYTNYKKDIKYYLHLPKIAYALSRLPSEVKTKSGYAQLSQALKSPRNALYFRSIATWIELLNRQESEINSDDYTY